MTDYFLQILATVLLALYFATVKAYQKREGESFKKGFFFNALLGLFTAIIFFVINGFKMEFSWFSLGISVLITVLVTSYTLISFQLLKSGTVTLYTMFLMSGGMLVPYFWGLVFFNEKIDIFNVLGIICMLVAIVMINGDFKNINKKQIFMCAIVFFFNGFVSVSIKTHQISEGLGAIGSVDFQILSSLVKFVICIIIFFFIPKDKGEKTEKPMISIWGIALIFISAAVSGSSSVLQFFGAETIPATVLYPIITGGTIIFSAITSRIFFKEVLRKKDIVAIIICFIGTLLFV